ncbi:hypothetical protein AC578_7382 [Pseudocercospora eumusae]|uniref:FAD/NAD(P)-binding domain-containing protein n=1 Tax=Pseudocercospora eumusae TaxID=321146 RepID=A0A139H304_9PEZI|nr:hypothetical protein AC578_7382 [Pseudocercospora eumusae]
MATADVLQKVDLLGPQQEQVNLQADFEKAPQSPASFDPVALKQKYLEERDRRLKQPLSGIDQYQLIDENSQFAHYLKDPWCEPFQRDPVSEVDDVLIVGGGYGAQLVAVRLIEAGVKNIRMLEKAGDFGGTWYWNRYPGAQCDIESYIYMPLLEELGYMPTEKYAYASELLAHSERIGKRYGLYERTLFQTEVHEMRWDEASSLWTIKTDRNDDIKSRFIIPAAGPLHRPKLPGVKGIDKFKGKSFHSGRWDYKYTKGHNRGDLTGLGDKRVAVIGTGATAVQIVPNVAKYAKETFVFQRTPSSIDVRGNRPTDPAWAQSLKPGWQKERMENFNVIVNGGVLETDLVKDGWTDILHKLLARGAANPDDPEAAAAERQMADFEKMNEIRARTDRVITAKKETADALKPWYNQLCKRPCFHDEYLQAFNADNVHLIDTKGAGITEITEKGIIANGQEFELDCIVYATGFEIATDWSHRSNMEIYGRNGQSITECWREGARTLHGWTTHGFPNCFWVQIVQAALTPNFLHVTAEQARHLAYVIQQIYKRGINTLEASQKAEEEWVKTIEEMAGLRSKFLRECTPGYYNNEGSPSKTGARNASYGGGSPAFIKILDDWRDEDKLEGCEVSYLKN